jgi:hypothetical protein
LCFVVRFNEAKGNKSSSIWKRSMENLSYAR